MSHNLYFLALIAQALEKADPGAELHNAFVEIERLGRLPEYSTGYRQYRRFMRDVAVQLSELDREAETASWIEAILAGDESPGAASPDLDQSRPSVPAVSPDTRKVLYQGVLSALSTPPDPAVDPVLDFIRAGESVGSVRAVKSPAKAELVDLRPGPYQIVLNTGRLLWAGELTDSDLLLSAAQPGRPLRLAAASGSTGDRPSRQVMLLDGGIVMDFYPGIQSGRVEVDFRQFGGQ